MTLYHEQLKELLHYEPTTGWFTWIVQYNSRTLVGSRAGTLQYGRRKIQIGGIQYYSGRLAWFYMTGKWPTCLIDHKDRDKQNDAWLNLREANYCESTHNRILPVGQSGHRGVRRIPSNPHRWEARIAVGNSRMTLGAYDSAEEAHKAYLAASEKLHGKFAPHQYTPGNLKRRL